MKNFIDAKKKLIDIECELCITEAIINILLEYAYENHAGFAEILEIARNKLLTIFDIIDK